MVLSMGLLVERMLRVAYTTGSPRTPTVISQIISTSKDGMMVMIEQRFSTVMLYEISDSDRR